MNEFSRMLELINEEDFKKIQNTKILLVGIGGVGGSCLENLVRCGFTNITIVDNDIVDITNLNRQIISLHSNISLKKVEVAKKRILDINPLVNINILDKFLLKEDIINLDTDFNYIIDCCDTLTTKLELVLFANEHNINIISSCGTGNRIDPTKLIITDIYKTNNDPLAKRFRKVLRENNIKKLTVVCSSEIPKKTNDVVGSISMVPNTAGCYLAYYVFNNTLKPNI